MRFTDTRLLSYGPSDVTIETETRRHTRCGTIKFPPRIGIFKLSAVSDDDPFSVAGTGIESILSLFRPNPYHF